MKAMFWLDNLQKLINIKNTLAKNLIVTIFFSAVGVMILGNQLHFYYPDEFANILGGYFISQGRFPYVGFFDHHNPFTYFFAFPIVLIAGQSFVKFRLLLGVVYLAMAVFLYRWIKIRFGVEEGKLILVWIFFAVLGATYWWGHMLLADSLAAYLLMAPVFLLFLTIWKKEALNFRDLWVISIFSSLTILTTFTLIYAIFIIYLVTTYWFIRTNSDALKFKVLRKFILIMVIPYLFFVFYLLVTGSISDYLYQSVWFNSKYYANIPGGVGVKNPLRVAVVLFHNFFFNFKATLSLVKDFNFGSPFIQTLALANTVLIVYLVIEKRFLLAAFTLLMLIYGMVRSNPYTTTETDYQGMSYHLLSIFNGLVVLKFLWQRLQNPLEYARKLFYSAFLLSLGAYFFFFGLYLLEKDLDKTYQKYMGTQALIYDRPSVAPLLDELLSKNDYYFIGPFDFENQLYIKEKPASKYAFVIPAMDQAEKIQKEMLADLQKNQPKIIVFDTEYRIFGTKPGSFLQQYIKDNYFNLEQLGAPCLNYKATTAMFGQYGFERHFFFLKSTQQEQLQKLLDKKLIAPVDPQAVPEFCHDRFREQFSKKP